VRRNGARPHGITALARIATQKRKPFIIEDERRNFRRDQRQLSSYRRGSLRRIGDFPADR